MKRRRSVTEAGVAPRAEDGSASFVFAAAAAMLLTTTLTVPAFAVLPVLASVALAGAALAALAARWRSRSGDPRALMLRDVAGGCALVGVAAAIFSGPAQVVETFSLFAR